MNQNMFRGFYLPSLHSVSLCGSHFAAATFQHFWVHAADMWDRFKRFKQTFWTIQTIQTDLFSWFFPYLKETEWKNVTFSLGLRLIKPLADSMPFSATDKAFWIGASTKKQYKCKLYGNPILNEDIHIPKNRPFQVPCKGFKRLWKDQNPKYGSRLYLEIHLKHT